jgi:putative FmdB family regulatory protein
MPLYEYVCDECKRKFSWLVGVVADDEKPSCPRCGSVKYQKIISRVFRGRSEDAVLDDFADDDMGDLDDPKQAREFAKRMGKEFGDDFEQEVEAAIEEETSGSAPGETEDWSD